PPMVSRLGEILSHHKGDSEVRIKLQGPTRTTVLRLDRHRGTPDPALFGDLKVLLGPSCLAGGPRRGSGAEVDDRRGAPAGGCAPLPASWRVSTTRHEGISCGRNASAGPCPGPCRRGSPPWCAAR